jgi:hypothetical protein
MHSQHESPPGRLPARQFGAQRTVAADRLHQRLGIVTQRKHVRHHATEKLIVGVARSAAERVVGPDDDGIVRFHAGAAFQYQDDIVGIAHRLVGQQRLLLQ